MNAIRLEKVSKRFRRYSRPRRPTTLKSALVDLISGRRGSEDGQYLWALNDIDLEVPQGTTLGIIGRNGSGKSTILKILAGIYRATSGSVEVNGRVSALIELGAGFHPELSGRENIFINGMILGLSRREIRQKFDEIVAFAELEDFIDAPVRTYSSGMYARLGFSVAVSVNPDILLVDEILSVGDEAFMRRCNEKMAEFMREGKTLILVTHDLSLVDKFCRLAIWIEGGEMHGTGMPKEVVDSYKSFMAEKGVGKVQSQDGKRWGDGRLEIEDVKCLDASGTETNRYSTGEGLTILIHYRVHQHVEDVVFGLGFFRSDGLWCYGTNTLVDGIACSPLNEEGEVRIDIGSLDLLEGAYLLDIAVHDKNGGAYDYRSGYISIQVSNDRKEGGVMRLNHKWRFL